MKRKGTFFGKVLFWIWKESIHILEHVVESTGEMREKGKKVKDQNFGWISVDKDQGKHRRENTD